MNFCESRTHSCKRITGWVFVGFTIAFLFALLFGFIVKMIWGVTLTPMFGLVEPSYFQAVGIIILGRLIFGGFGKHRPPHKNPKQKFYDKIHERFRANCSSSGDDHQDGEENTDNCMIFHKFWKDEGKDAFNTYLKKTETGE